MSAQPLLSPEGAANLTFAEIARNLRENVEEARVKRLAPANEELLHKLLHILEEKIFDAHPGRPPRPKVPPPPRAPIKQRLPELRIPDSRAYKLCQDRYRERITTIEREARIGSKKERRLKQHQLQRLHREMELKLTELALKEQSPSFQETWRNIVRERTLFRDRLRRYHRELDAYHHRTASLRHVREIWDAQYGPTGGERKICERITTHLRSDVEAYLRGDVLFGVRKVPWRFLPPGAGGMLMLAAEIRELKRRYPHLQYDEERLLHAHSLNPSQVYVGEDEFEGYFAFVFDGTRHVLLENPQEGNAAYIFRRDWASLSKLPKFDLLDRFPDCVERVLHRHTGNWKWRIKAALQL